MKYKCIVIGAGSAGAFRVEGNHASSYQAHPLCNLVGIYDVSPNNAGKASESYGCKQFRNLKSALQCNPDIVSLALSPENRQEALKRIWKTTSIKAIFCEKPVAYTTIEALNLLKNCKDAGKRLYVNFQRRANSCFNGLRAELREHERGDLQNAIIYYTRGMWTNACHWIDLSLMLFGRPRWIMAQDSPIPSPYDDDPNVTLLMGYTSFHLHLIPLLSWDEGFYTGDLELTFEKERLFIPNSLHYQTRHLRRWKAQNKLLEEVGPEISLENIENDFFDMLDMIVLDIEEDREESVDPEESVWTTKILELADKSRKDYIRVDIPDSLDIHIG